LEGVHRNGAQFKTIKKIIKIVFEKSSKTKSNLGKITLSPTVLNQDIYPLEMETVKDYTSKCTRNAEKTEFYSCSKKSKLVQYEPGLRTFNLRGKAIH
jgi:hypothetical protein